ncbi:hypothetical protein EBU95_04985 [bacterium]|nr:hypothetical protein [bacterium]
MDSYLICIKDWLEFLDNHPTQTNVILPLFENFASEDILVSGCIPLNSLYIPLIVCKFSSLWSTIV